MTVDPRNRLLLNQAPSHRCNSMTCSRLSEILISEHHEIIISDHHHIDAGNLRRAAHLALLLRVVRHAPCRSLPLLRAADQWRRGRKEGRSAMAASLSQNSNWILPKSQVLQTHFGGKKEFQESHFFKVENQPQGGPLGALLGQSWGLLGARCWSAFQPEFPSSSFEERGSRLSGLRGPSSSPRPDARGKLVNLDPGRNSRDKGRGRCAQQVNISMCVYIYIYIEQCTRDRRWERVR